MPVYNVEKYLDEAINSILRQTFGDFELIIVNDGSTDSSNLIVQKYKAINPRITLIHQVNSGLSAARNKGLKYASGTYVYFFDSDDVLDETAFQHIYKLISENTYPDVVAFNAKPFLDGGYDISNREDVLQFYLDYFARRDHFPEKQYPGVEFYREMATDLNFVAPVFLYVIKNSLLKDIKLKFVPGVIHEDEIYTRYLFVNANRIVFTQKKLYCYRLREASITQAAISKHKIISQIKVVNRIYALYKSKKIPELRNDAIRLFLLAIDLYEKKDIKDRTLFMFFVSSKLFLFIPGKQKTRLLKLQFPILHKVYLKFREILSS